MTEAKKLLKSLEAERNRLWAEARMKGLPAGSPERDRIVQLDQEIGDRKLTLRE